MKPDPDCIFCKIIRGDLPSIRVREDDRTLAFMDINPVNPGHVLVVPKFHAADLFDIPATWLTATVAAAQKVAKAVHATLRPHGLNLVQSNGPGAAQSVFHLHIHVVPRGRGDDLKMNWGLKPGDREELGRLAERIRANID